MDFRQLRGVQQLGQPKISLAGTVERATALEDGKVKIENVAYDKDGNELVIATAIDTVENLAKKKAAYEANAAKVGALLEQIK